MEYSASLATQALGFFPKSVSFSQILITLLFANFLVFVFVYLRYSFRRYQYSKHIPGMKPNFFNVLGNMQDMPKLAGGFDFNVGFLQLFSAYHQLFGKHKIFCVWVSYAPFLIAMKAQAIEELIVSKNTRKSWSYDFLHPWLGTGLLTSYGSKWKSRRKLLTPSFHFDILKEFLPIFNEQSQKLVTILRSETTKDFTDIVLPVTLCSLDVICETTLGVSIKAQDNKDSEYVKAVNRVSNIIMERTMKFKYWHDGIFALTEVGRQHKAGIKLLHEFTRSVIREKKQKLLSGVPLSDKKRKALMDVLLEHHIQTKQLSEEDIREEVDTFTFEGHDTTSMGMSWALYLIGLHKDVQDKLHEELYRIFGDDAERSITTDDLKDMDYLDCVLKESQRLYPSVPFFGREATEDMKICGYTVPKGTTITGFTYLLHRDEEVFPNPEKFDPDRFLPENSVNRHPYAYIPFSAGPRNCIGQRFAIMEEKVIISYILRNYTLESLDARDKVVPVAELILRNAVPIRIKIRPRQHN